MARPEIKGLHYFPFDVGFFGDKKVKLLRGEHHAEGVEVYQRLLCKCYEDNGYFLEWESNIDCVLLAEETGFSINKIRTIISTCLKWSLFDDKLFRAGNVLTSRSIQRRYFSAVQATREAAARKGRHTFILGNMCLLTDNDLSELNKAYGWLKVVKNPNKSEINPNKSKINPSKSEIDPIKESKENKSKEEKAYSPPSGGNARAGKHHYGEYKHVLLTDAEYQRFIQEAGEERANSAVKYLDEYIQMKGYKAKDHNLVIRKWVFKALDEQQRTTISATQSAKKTRFHNFEGRKWDYDKILEMEQKYLDVKIEQND